MEEVENGKYRHQIFQLQDRADVSWCAPSAEYIRLDVDGSRSQQGWATCGGLARDSQGSWLLGFQQKMGFVSTMAAELQAIKAGIQLCKTNGWKNVQLYSDSLEAIQLLFAGCGNDHPLYDEVEDIQALLLYCGNLEIIHVNREALVYADLLAKCAHEMEPNWRLLQTPPPTVYPNY